MSSPIAILPVCLESTIATIRDLETKIAGWSMMLTTATSASIVSTLELYIIEAKKQLIAFQQIEREQRASLVELTLADQAVYCECGELADGEMAEVVRNGRHVLVHVNGCMLPGDLLA